MMCAANSETHERQQSHRSNDCPDRLPEAAPVSELLFARGAVGRIVELVRGERHSGVRLLGVVAAEEVVVIETGR